MWSAHGLAFHSYLCTSFKRIWKSLTFRGLLEDYMMPVCNNVDVFGVR